MGDAGADAGVRERLLAAASDLFYREGVHRVTLERVIEVSGVAPHEVQAAFGGKDELVRAYLRARHTRTRQRIENGLKRFGTARQRLIGVFALQGESFGEPGFRGCAFVTASAEAWPGEVVEDVAREYRDWLHNLFFGLAYEARARHPERLAQQLVVLYDGGAISAWMDHRPDTAAATTAVATALIDNALAG